MMTARESFERDGYLILEHVFEAGEVKALKEEARSIISDKRETGNDRVKQAIGTGVYVGIAAEHPMFKYAASHPILVRTLKAILGDKVKFLVDKIVFKDDSTANFGSPWHQDRSYWPGNHRLSVWIALDDAVPENGCLQFIPGSHKDGVIDHGRKVTDGIGFERRLQDPVRTDKAVDMPAKAGTAIIFHDLLLHASHPNSSGSDRWSLISTYKDGTLPDSEDDARIGREAFMLV